jgi:hypothetical protein
MRYVGIRSAQSVAICVKGYIFVVLREKNIDTKAGVVHSAHQWLRSYAYVSYFTITYIIKNTTFGCMRSDKLNYGRYVQ